MWPTFLTETRFLSVAHIVEVWPIFSSVTHFCKREPFLRVWPIFPNITHFSKFNPFFKTIVLLYAFFQMWPILPELTYFFFLKMTHFSTCDASVVQFGPIFQSVTQFFKCNPFFQEWRIFPSVTHLRKSDPFCTRDPFLQLTSCYAIIGGIYLSAYRVSRGLLGGTG